MRLFRHQTRASMVMQGNQAASSRLFILGIVSTLTISSCSAAPLTIAAQGKSTFSIIVPQTPAHSVQNAAVELQRDIAEATGAQLPLQKDNETVNGAFISLGSTQQAKAAGISAGKMAPDAFRIVTQKGNLYIIGMDTTTVNLRRGREDVMPDCELHPEIPGPAFTRLGGFSRGTANGVYTFLEKYLDVRWLFPGDLGRDVPGKSTFTIEPLDITETPLFNFRVLGVRGDDDWQDHLKLGYSSRIHFTHNFVDTVPSELYDTHPGWFPMYNGVRPRPPKRGYKLETTNPGLVRYFAEQAIAALKADPQMTTYSLSPSDGWGFSESPESRALYDPPAPGMNTASVTPLVLKFYRDVCAIVAKEYPQGLLAGYLYTIYSHPPTKGGMDLPGNFIPVIVGKSMGYSFYRPEVRSEEAGLLQAWSKVAPENWYYYGMPTWLRESSAQVTPAAPDELNFLYHNLVKAHIKGAYIYGTYKWSQGALVNYLHAKMLWDPTADARAIQHDWLMRAYGPGAGAIMEQLYHKLDQSWFADYFRSPQSTHYNLSDVMFRDTFGAHYPEMEKLFLEAAAQPMTDKQKQRLDLIKYNMIALQWRLRNAGDLPADYNSPLTRSTAQVFELFTNNATADVFSYVIVRRNGAAITPVKVLLNQPAAGTPQSTMPNNQHLLLYPTQDGKITLQPANVHPGASFLVYYVQDEKGKRLARGFLADGSDITFPVKANHAYYFQTTHSGVTLRPEIKWQLSIPGAAPATATFQHDTVYLQPSHGATNAALYVYVPDSMKLEHDGNATGVIVQTPSDAKSASRAAKAAKDAAEKALQTALAKYQGSVIVNLNEKWQFRTDLHKSGETEGFYRSDFDDSTWKSIKTVGSWQDNGFPDYHGTAWYRKTITVSRDETDPLAAGGKQLLLFFGAVDGDAEFYLNGVKIGEHLLANYGKGWEVPVVFNVSPLLRPGKNVLAIKVMKERFAGGIYRGVSLLSGVMPKP